MGIHIASGQFPLNQLNADQTAFVIHGGAGPQDPKGPEMEIARQAIAAIAETVRDADLADFPHLRDAPDTHLADQTALIAALHLENHPSFNAGFGAAIQADGLIRVSAAYMESTRRKFSGVINVRDLRHPSQLAHLLQGHYFSVLDAVGCDGFLRDLCIARENLFTPKRFNRWLELRQKELDLGTQQADGKGTIGCVAIDHKSNLTAVTSTGGVGNETPGRVGDTPTVAGNYCSQRVAVSCTGYGEHILDDGFAVRLATRAEDGSCLETAMRRCLDESMARNHGLAAIALFVDEAGEHVTWVAGTTEDYFVWAAVTADGVRVFNL